MFYEVSQTGSRMGPDMASEWVPEWPQNDLQMTLPDWSPDDPPDDLWDPEIGLSHMAVSNKAYFTVLLTIAELKGVSSQDWIRPPTQSQE